MMNTFFEVLVEPLERDFQGEFSVVEALLEIPVVLLELPMELTFFAQHFQTPFLGLEAPLVLGV